MTAFEQLLCALGARSADAAAWAPPLLAACQAHQINTPLRLAALLANVLHETTSLTQLRESLNYSDVGLRATWPTRFSAEDAQRLGRTAAHIADQRGIAERAYGGRLGNGSEGSGDGWGFRGGGGLMNTGRANYTAFGKAIGWAGSLETLVAYITTVDGAAASAGAFFEAAGCIAPADRGDIASVRRLINGGCIGLADVQKRYAAALTALHAAARSIAPSTDPQPVITADDLNARELDRVRSYA